jgi:hydrogenase maturation protein HypF
MRLALLVRGTVQGVGFRPFVRRSALACGLTGFVQNGRDAVRIEIQGAPSAVEAFTRALQNEHPPAALVRALERERLEERQGETAFEIVASDGAERAAPLLPPDLGMCADCWREVQSRGDRRHRYPFTNCVACGPRYSIVLDLPYDRPSTSMRAFRMCDGCAREYGDVDDRRYHAQPIACPTCGPELASWDRFGRVLARGEDALGRAARLLRGGGILALRGLGGFQLMCDATDARTVMALRERKRRPHKPFAVMFRDADQLAVCTDIAEPELRVLTSPAAPIVLVPRRAGCATVCDEVANRSPYVGAMLPYTPLHGLLLAQVGSPVVCTSGNLSEEPICTSNEEALERLGGIADGFLCHDRPIVRPVDDSVVRVARGARRRTVVLRRARGYAPLPVARVDARARVLALGAHLKSTVTLACRGMLIPTQHLGDLDAHPTRALLERATEDLLSFFDVRPALVACDLHPDYASTLLAEKLAERWAIPIRAVQHHHAHVAACMAEHHLSPDQDVLGFAWDGTGAGLDETIWGGEALVCRGSTFRRAVHLRTFPLPGGDSASRDPRRVALGLLFAFAPDGAERWAARWFGDEGAVHLRALELRLNAPACSSMGRLFDGVAALAGIDAPTTFEGQAAMRLEDLATRTPRGVGTYPLPLRSGPEGASVVDVAPLVHAVIADVERGTEQSLVARRFHDALIDLGVRIAELEGVPRVALGGGCFQNQLLANGLESRLEEKGFQVFAASAIPPNDGGISVGQAWIASMDPRSW